MTNLVPHRHDPDLFVADLSAAPLKELAEHLEFPFFGLAPQPHHGVRRFEDDQGNYIELRPGLEGLPTIHDQDVMIYCMSKAMAEIRRGNPVPERIWMTAAELLRFTNRRVGGSQYAAVEASIYRLTELTLVTNLRGEENTYTELFGIVDRASMVRRNSLARHHGGALLGCSVVLSSWIREALEARRVLTLHGDYFRLRSPLERAVYQLVRKHCGEQPDWKIGLAKLRNKVGSRDGHRSFRQQLRTLSARWDGQDFLGYRIGFGDDLLTAGYAGGTGRVPADRGRPDRRISAKTLDALARELPRLDPGRMETVWRTWAARRAEPARNAQAAFLGFCRRYAELRGHGDRQDRDGPPPLMGEQAHPEALRWWRGLTPGQREAAVGEFRICGEGTDWAFARTEKQIVERAARDWGGVSLAEGPPARNTPGRGTRQAPAGNPAPSFPASGGLGFAEPWDALAREHAVRLPGGYVPDLGTLADAFRQWCRTEGIPLDAPRIESTFIGFCRKYRPPR